MAFTVTVLLVITSCFTRGISTKRTVTHFNMFTKFNALIIKCSKAVF